ncbi:GNAT family N-acetyltransferase, partial [Paenibacillus ihuae]|uniref:GNAT family N-acetyltransferase n=1 Tax=Paenibacillus ihuae TaxID=1232431 RepID=UPI0006D57068
MYKTIEELTLNTWPAEQSVLLEGWILRTAAGYTKRSNSVNPLFGPAKYEQGLDVQHKIQLAEQYYERAGLKPVFKITLYTRPADLDALLTELGYLKDSPSSVRVRELQELPPLQRRYPLLIRGEMTEEWLGAFSQQAKLNSKQRDTLCRMLGASFLQQGYALLLKDGVPAACGLGVIQHGYIGLYDIITAPAYRRQGLAEELVTGLLHWGKMQGLRLLFCKWSWKTAVLPPYMT